MSPPVSEKRLQQIANDACDSSLESAESYTHTSTNTWNTAIINHMLNSLISESRPDANTPPPWKFAINSTIIQHLQPSAGEGAVGRRGMHSATGAFWNQEKDGMWNFKYEGGEKKGMDVVISVVWIAL